LQVDYAAPVRDFLVKRFARVTVVTFERAVFPGALVDVVILLAEDGPRPEGLRVRSEEHTSELQSRGHLVCRLLLEKKNNNEIIDRGERKINLSRMPWGSVVHG